MRVKYRYRVSLSRRYTLHRWIVMSFYEICMNRGYGVIKDDRRRFGYLYVSAQKFDRSVTSWRIMCQVLDLVSISTHVLEVITSKSASVYQLDLVAGRQCEHERAWSCSSEYLEYGNVARPKDHHTLYHITMVEVEVSKNV